MNNQLLRRKFLKLSAATALIPAFNLPAFASPVSTRDVKNKLVDLRSDGLTLTPKEYAELLMKLTEKDQVAADSYSLGTCVEELEIKFARLLGKEAAVFMPTGTLANHLAIRSLSGQNKRVIVQQESHVYNDTGDSTQLLSNLNLIPLSPNKATFTVEEVDAIVKRTVSGRVASKVGVISIESPVRRKTGEVFDYTQMQEISKFAKSNNIKMHLDGARIFLASAYEKIPVTDYTSLFDTVYVSLYKYFNAACGAILAGPKSIIENMFHERRMFGSGLYQAWMFAAVANHFADGFEERFAQSVSIAEDLIKRLAGNPQFTVDRIPSGTNIWRLKLKNTTAALFIENLKRKGVVIRAAGEAMPNDLIIHVNESLLRSSAAALEEAFAKSLSN